MLININTLKERRDIAMVSIVNDLVSQRNDSMEILSNLNFYVPSRQLRNRSLFITNHQPKKKYAKFGPLNQMMNIYNQHCETIDFTTSRHNIKCISTSLQLKIKNGVW